MNTVATEIFDDIFVVTLNRLEVRNAVDGDTAQALHAAFLAFEDDPLARVAVFHGANGHFCAGWDLQHGARLASWTRLPLIDSKKSSESEIEATSSRYWTRNGEWCTKPRSQYSGWCRSAKPPSISARTKFSVSAARS